MVAGQKPIPKRKTGCRSPRFHNRTPFRGHFCVTSLINDAVGCPVWSTGLQMAVSDYSSTPKCPGGDPPRAVVGPPRVAFSLAAGAAVLLLGCSTAGHVDRASSSLVAGMRVGPMSRAQLAPAAEVAERFGRAYARAVYRRRPPSLPDASPAVQAHLRASAAHVPLARRRSHPRVGSIRLRPVSARVLAGSVVIASNAFPSFAVGFTVRRTRFGWRVTSISPPG